MRKMITKETFWAVKTLLKGGASLKETAEFFKLCYGTVSKINIAETFEEYRINGADKKRIAYLKSKAEKAASAPVSVVDEVVPIPEPPKAPEPTEKHGKPMYMPYATQKEIMDRLREQNHLLREQNELLKEQTEAYKTLSAKMVFIIEQLA